MINFKFKMNFLLLINFFYFINTNSTINLLQLNDKDFTSRILQNSCDPDSCPPLQGYCRDDTCTCLDGYITIKDAFNHKFCNYKQKSVIIALLLESFGLIGFGHLYAGRMFYGLLKLFSFYLIICYGSQFVIAFMKQNSDTDAAYYIKLGISVSCLGVPVLWHLIDLYKFATNQYLDGNDQPMESW